MKAFIRTNLDSICVDGMDHEVSYSIIIAELPSGARYILNNSETNHYYYDKSKGLVRIDDDVVYARMNKLVDKINARGYLNFENWTGTAPRYGSQRHTEQCCKM